MAPTWFGTTNAWAFIGSSTTLNVTVPSGVADDDLLLLMALQRNSSSAGLTLPAGWTEDDRVSIGGNSSAVFAHRVASSEPGSYNMGFAASSTPEAVVLVGVTNYAATRAAAFTSAGGTSGTVGPVASVSGDLLVALYGVLVDMSETASATALSGYSAVSGGSGGGVAYRAITKTAAGAESAQSFTAGTGVAPAWAGSLWALSSAPLGGWGVGMIRMGA